MIHWADIGGNIDVGPVLTRVRGKFSTTDGEQPKVILIQNHGIITLGQSAQHALNVMAMVVKTARILLGSYAAGGPRFMSERDVARIHTRPDEHFRRLQLGLEK